MIEIGTAIGLGKPYFYFNYADKRMVQIGSKREKITTASDLAGMLYMPYREYDVLLREFAIRLPLFLCDRRVRKEREGLGAEVSATWWIQALQSLNMPN